MLLKDERRVRMSMTSQRAAAAAAAVSLICIMSFLLLLSISVVERRFLDLAASFLLSLSWVELSKLASYVCYSLASQPNSTVINWIDKGHI